MLVNKNYEQNTVVSFKLVTGEEIVAKVLEVTDTAFIISKPTSVVPSQHGIGLLQSLYTSESMERLELSKQHVLFHAVTAKQVETYYISTTTGIETVGAGELVI